MWTNSGPTVTHKTNKSHQFTLWMFDICMVAFSIEMSNANNFFFRFSFFFFFFHYYHIVLDSLNDNWVHNLIRTVAWCFWKFAVKSEIIYKLKICQFIRNCQEHCNCSVFGINETANHKQCQAQDKTTFFAIYFKVDVTNIIFHTQQLLQFHICLLLNLFRERTTYLPHNVLHRQGSEYFLWE